MSAQFDNLGIEIELGASIKVISSTLRVPGLLTK